MSRASRVVAGLALGVVLGAAGAALALRFRAWPHGPGSDSIAIWLLRARTLARGGPAYDPGLVMPRYPLLVPVLIAGGWTMLGTEALWVPHAVAVAGAAACVLILVGGLTTLRGWVPAAWAAVALFGPPAFLRTAADLIADVPLAATFVGGLVSVVLARERGHPRHLVLAGLAWGLGTHTKQEGLLLAGAGTLVVVAWTARREGLAAAGRSLAGLAVGLLLPLGLLAWHLRAARVASEYLGPVRTLARRALDPARHAAIWGTLGRWGAAHAPLALPVALVALIPGARAPAQWASARLAATVVGVAGGVYYGVYLLTPYDLTWQLDTSLHRLLVHLWPAALLAVFLAWPSERCTATGSPPCPPPGRRNQLPLRGRGPSGGSWELQ